MSTIDWSKAPEGTTHFGPNHDFLVENWFKRDECGWSIWECARWTVCRGGLQKLREETMVQRPPVQPWSGEGLPPSGVVCEYDARPVGKGDPLWVTVEVKYLSEWTIVLMCTAVPEGIRKENIGVELSIDVVSSTANKFRPIRTPEQIAAEERAKAIREMMDLATCRDTMADLCGELYDAGYRKQVTP